MKKQIKKLNLNKRTISNLGAPEMTKIVGGMMPGPSGGQCFSNKCNTAHGHTCNGNNNCV